MTTGLVDNLETYEVPNRGSASWVYYGSRVEWNGEDRPITVTIHPPTFKTRVRQYRMTVRTDHHVTHVDVSKPLVWAGDIGSDESQNRRLFYADHAYAKTWEVRSVGVLDIDRYLWSDGSLWEHWAGTVSNAGAFPLEPLNEWSAGDEYKLLAKLQSRVQGNDFNLASFLGAEGYDSLRLIFDSANRIYRAGRAVKHGYFQRALAILRNENQQWVATESKRLGVKGISATRVSRWKDRERRRQQELIYEDQVKQLRSALAGDKSPRKGLGVLANLARISSKQWLEFHLAVEPLLGDVQAAAEKLSHRLNLPQKKTYVATRQQSYDRKYGTYGPALNQNQKLVRKRIKYNVEEDASVPQLLGLYNPEIVLWNALPLSFVGDYMLPIGQWLEARGFSQSLTGTFVVSTKVAWSASGLHWRNDYSQNSFVRETWTVGSCWILKGSFNREVLTGLPVPLPNFSPLGAVKSWQRAATSVSLLVGSLTGGNLLRHTR